MTYKIKKLLLIILVICGFSFHGLAEDPDPPPPAPPPCPGPYDPPVGSPIEDGVPIILGLAMLYGAVKLHQTRRKLNDPEKEKRV